MHTLGVRFAASVSVLDVLRCWKTEQKVEEAKPQQRPHYLQQFFTGFTNSNRTLNDEYGFTKQVRNRPKIIPAFRVFWFTVMSHWSLLIGQTKDKEQRTKDKGVELVKAPKLVLGKLIPVRSVTTTEIFSAIVRRVGAL